MTGGDGIGAGVAVRLDREGANVVVADNERQGGRRVGGRPREVGTGRFVPADLGDEAAVEALVADTVEAYGGVDVVVNVDGGRLVSREPEPVEQPE